MYFESINGALSMAGHGAYVWSAYIITTIVITALIAVPVQRTREIRQRLRKRRHQPADKRGDRIHAS